MAENNSDFSPGYCESASESSDSEDQFTDAQSNPMSPTINSPIPKTRVERVDDQLAHGEVPGTEAYKIREGDAVPDEIAIIPEQDSAAAPTAQAAGIPTTVVEEAPGDIPGGHTAEFERKREADAQPDQLIGAGGEEQAGNDDVSSDPTISQPSEVASPRLERDEPSESSQAASSQSQPEEHAEDQFDESPQVLQPASTESQGEEPVEDGNNEPSKAQESATFDSQGEDPIQDYSDESPQTLRAASIEPQPGELVEDDFDEPSRPLESASINLQNEEAVEDDFDDFEEGGGDNDFDDFEDGFQEPAQSTAPAPPPQTTLPYPIPDFDGLDADDISSATEPQLASLFPPEELDLPPFPPLSTESSIFLTQRSASLWSQLVAPPPLAPPDWIRSRTRRLFLVSLGVPVDLDEILPASKQKKLVLPSLNVPSASPRNSSESRSVSRLRQGEHNNSSTSVDTQGKPTGSKRRKGPPPQPDLDLVAARHLCMATDEALDGMTNEELKEHVAKLEAMQGTANEMLEYWKKRTDEKIGDREAFEGVIENLVKHARKVRT
ncbi:hypothetical protein S40288_08257 [Stachybotrys chartarum IBT 40288]|nr:hypothetical protein S40288_08257 [Stachybotrys chartarum IBT 40288]